MMDKRKAFGEELASRRAERGVSLEEMARVTKVRKPILEALEAGRLDELPPDVFTAGFLRVYAGHLGMNPVQVVSRYKLLTEPVVPAQPKERPAFEGASWGRTAATVALLAALAVVAVWLWWSHREGRWPFSSAWEVVAPGPKPADSGTGAAVPSPSSRPPHEPPSETPVRQPGEPGGASPTVAAPAPSGETPPTSAPAATGAPSAPAPAIQSPSPSPAVQGDVVLSCSQSCWLEMWADGRRVVYRQLTPGEQLAFDGQRFRFNIGNTAGLQLTWRGRPVALPQERGRVLKDFVLPIPPEGTPPR
jgi:cytoskeleton protein RodZ